MGSVVELPNRGKNGRAAAPRPPLPRPIPDPRPRPAVLPKASYALSVTFVPFVFFVLKGRSIRGLTLAQGDQLK